MLVVIVEEHKASSTTRLDSITYGHGRIIGMEQNYTLKYTIQLLTFWKKIKYPIISVSEDAVKDC